MDKVRMLVVEDERIVSMDLQGRLRSMGYEVVGAAVSGEEAIEKAGVLRPDMILMDIMLDGQLDGIQAAEIIRSRYGIPVIYLTAYADTATLERAKITEPFGYILKPFEERELHGHIEIALYKNRMEKRLRDSEERYVLASLGTNDGVWDWDLVSEKIYFSPRWKSMLGFDEDEIGQDPNEWFSRIHSEDRARVEQQVQEHIAGKAGHFESEYRILCKDGSYRWASTRGLALVDSSGKAYRMAGSQADITERKLYDPLTGLPNRILFTDKIGECLGHARAQHGHVAVLSLKACDFTDVVDGVRGDRDGLFLQITRRVQGSLRAEDTLGHLGEDTIGILFAGVRDAAEANVLAGHVLQSLNTPFELNEQQIHFQFRMGVAVNEETSTPEDLLRDSGIAMNRAKVSNRSQIEVFDPRMRRHVTARIQLEADLRRAIENEEFQVHYQPIVSLLSGEITGFEALVRWPQGDGAFRLPGEFIPLAEETGLIVPIERFVLNAAVRQMRDWERQMKPGSPITMSVNLSPQHYSEPGLVEEIKRLLKITGFDSRRLKLEITESALMRNTDIVAANLSQLDALNIKLAMDDFGTGYSSLSYLHQFPIKTLKIDKCFVSNLGRRTESRKIVQAIVALGRNLGMDVTAEGVENRRQIVELQAFDCSHAQGYLFSKPVSREAITKLLSQKQLWLSEEDEFTSVEVAPSR
jgi:PAS domain S-box-containing protein/diguanylate cyclase (GGDEF)-like protein